MTFSNAIHICEVVVDVATGKLTLEHYLVVEDCGTVNRPHSGRRTANVAQAGLGRSATIVRKQTRRDRYAVSIGQRQIVEQDASLHGISQLIHKATAAGRRPLDDYRSKRLDHPPRVSRAARIRVRLSENLNAHWESAYCSERQIDNGSPEDRTRDVEDRVSGGPSDRIVGLVLYNLWRWAGRGWSDQRIHHRCKGCMFGADFLALQNEGAIAVRTETLRCGDHALGAEANAIRILGHQVAEIPMVLPGRDCVAER